jgi:alpha-1,3-glucosyltransferase
VLVYSILFIEEGRYVLGSVLFAVLLNMKHLFAYLGPVYFVFLLKHYVLADSSSSSSGSSVSWRAAAGRLVLLGGAVLAVCGASFGPFVAMGQMKQVRAISSSSSSSRPVTRQLLTDTRAVTRCIHTGSAD